MLKRQEEEMVQLQAAMVLRQPRLNPCPSDTVTASMLDITRDPLREMALETAMTQRKLRASAFSAVASSPALREPSGRASQMTPSTQQLPISEVEIPC